MQSAAFHQASYMAGQVLQEAQNVQHLVSRALESITPNQRNQENVPPPAPLFAPVANANIHANDTVHQVPPRRSRNI